MTKFFDPFSGNMSNPKGDSSAKEAQENDGDLTDTEQHRNSQDSGTYAPRLCYVLYVTSFSSTSYCSNIELDSKIN